MKLSKVASDVVVGRNELHSIIALYKKRKRRIAFVAGVFDLGGHAGQVFFFKQVQRIVGKRGVLVISVGTKEYARKKGLGRPFFSFLERAGTVWCLSQNKVIAITRHSSLAQVKNSLLKIRPDFYILSKNTGDLVEIQKTLIPELRKNNIRAVFVTDAIDLHTTTIIKRIKKDPN